MCSPNVTWVPRPPPTLRSLLLRADGRFGYDDPLLWPQPLTADNEHLACIERRGTSAWVDFWHSNLGDGDTKQLVACAGVFQTSQAFASKLLCAVGYIWSRVSECESRFGPRTLQRLRGLEASTRASLNRLQSARDSKDVLQCLWILASRYALETSAFMDYHFLFTPRLSRNHMSNVDHSRMGAIVRTEQMVEEFDMMGIPVWIIRPLKSEALFESKMKEVVTPVICERIVEALFPGHSTALLECDPWSDAYLAVLHDWARYTPAGAPMQVAITPSSSSVLQPATQPTPSVGTGKKRKRSKTKVGKQETQAPVKKRRKSLLCF